MLSAKDQSICGSQCRICDGAAGFYIWYQKGFATCYLGDAKSKPDLDQYQPMIVVAFGKAAATAVKKAG